MTIISASFSSLSRARSLSLSLFSNQIRHFSFIIGRNHRSSPSTNRRARQAIEREEKWLARLFLSFSLSLSHECLYLISSYIARRRRASRTYPDVHLRTDTNCLSHRSWRQIQIVRGKRSNGGGREASRFCVQMWEEETEMSRLLSTRGWRVVSTEDPIGSTSRNKTDLSSDRSNLSP